MRTQRRAAVLLVWSLATGIPALAQVGAPTPGNQSAAPGTREPAVQVFLIRQDSSDCTNSDVVATDPSLIGGTAWVVRNPDGKTSVTLAITAKPNTTYHVYLKCGGQLGDITTEDEGQGVATFSFTTSPTGEAYALEMHPEGAAANSKYQSVKVTR
jgi:hypothetical protein